MRRVLLLGLVMLLLVVGVLAEIGMKSLPEGRYLFYAAGDDKGVYLYDGDGELYRWRIEDGLITSLGKVTAIDPRVESIAGICVIEGRVYGTMLDVGELRLLYEERPGGQQKIALPGGSTYTVRLRTEGSTLWMMRSLGSSENHVLCRLNLDSGKYERFDETKGLYQYVPLPDDRVLLIDNFYEDGGYRVKFRMLNANSGKVTELMKKDGAVATPAYDAASRSVLYVAQSHLWRWSLGGEPEKLSPVSVANEWDHNPGQAFSGKLAVPYSGGIYLADPEAKSRGALHVIGDGSSSQEGRGYVAFLNEHPDVALSNAMSAANQENFGTGELAQRIMTGDLQYDVMLFSTHGYDLGRLIDKGYCADLSDDGELMALVHRMHPAIQAQVMREGKLYAMPVSGQMVDMLSVFPYGFEKTGLLASDLPQNLEQMIDLVGEWVDRTRYREEGVRPFEGDAAKVLKQYGIKSYMYRLLSRGEPLRFNDQRFTDLLQRIERQPTPKETEPGPFAFEFTQDPMEVSALPIPIFEGEDPVQPANLDVYIVNAMSGNQDLARQYLRCAMANLYDRHEVFLYADWTEPVERNYYKAWYEAWQQKEAELNAALAGCAKDDRPAIEAVEEQLRQHRAQLEKEQDTRYHATAEAIAHYQQRIAPYLFFPAPGVFTDWSQQSATLLNKEIDRYVKGQLSAEQFAASLDQMARLMELEGR